MQASSALPLLILLLALGVALLLRELKSETHSPDSRTPLLIASLCYLLYYICLGNVASLAPTSLDCVDIGDGLHILWWVTYIYIYI
jgi:hypothetical protein